MNVSLAQLNNSLSIDRRLYAEDIRGSLAYAQILSDAKIIQPDELKMIESGFKSIQLEWDSGEIRLRDDDEDVHSVNERRLTEIIGDVGRKLHTGRSRNDQVALDMKLWMKKAAAEVLNDVVCLLRVVIGKAEEKIDVIMPGYTHLQVIRRSFKTFDMPQGDFRLVYSAHSQCDSVIGCSLMASSFSPTANGYSS